MSNIKISVIISIYNGEKFVANCIESIFAQTLDGIEIILVDDGSKDSTPQICADYAAKYPEKIKVFTKVNEGPSIARNFVFPHARGEFVHFMDVDDTIDPDFYETCYNLAQEENSNVVFIDKSFDKETIKEVSSNNAWAAIVRKEVMDKHPEVRFPEHVMPADDSVFIHKLTAVLRGNGVSLNLASNYNYFVHPAGDHILVKKNSKKIFDQVPRWLESLGKFYDNYDWDYSGVRARKYSDAFYLAKMLNREPLGRLLSTPFTQEERKFLAEKIFDFYKKYVEPHINKEDYKNLPLRLRVFVETRSFKLTKFASSMLVFVLNLIPSKKLRRHLRWKLL